MKIRKRYASMPGGHGRRPPAVPSVRCVERPTRAISAYASEVPCRRTDAMQECNGASIRNIAEVLWQTPPEHYDAHSKMLVTPETAATKRFDYRISSYQPKGYVATHRHRVQEQVYHVLEGEGLMELDGVRSVVRTHRLHLHPAGSGARDLQHRPAGPGVHCGHHAADRRLKVGWCPASTKRNATLLSVIAVSDRERNLVQFDARTARASLDRNCFVAPAPRNASGPRDSRFSDGRY